MQCEVMLGGRYYTGTHCYSSAHKFLLLGVKKPAAKAIWKDYYSYVVTHNPFRELVWLATYVEDLL